jgi:hypothetical protein
VGQLDAVPDPLGGDAVRRPVGATDVRRVLIALLALAVAAVAVLVLVASRRGRPDATPAPGLLVGTAYDDHGRPMAGLTIVIVAAPTEEVMDRFHDGDKSIHFPTLAVVRTDTEGRFTATLDPSDLTAEYVEDGTIQVSANPLSRTGPAPEMVTAKVLREAGGHWRFADDPLPHMTLKAP